MDRGTFIREEARKLAESHDLERALTLIAEEVVKEDAASDTYKLIDTVKEVALGNNKQANLAVSQLERLIFQTPKIFYQLRLHRAITQLGGERALIGLINEGIRRGPGDIVDNVVTFALSSLIDLEVSLDFEWLDECYAELGSSADVCSALMEAYAKTGSSLAAERIETIFASGDRERLQTYYDQAQRALREIVVNDRDAIIAELNRLVAEAPDPHDNRNQFLANEDRVINLINALGSRPDDEIIPPIVNAIHQYGGKHAVIAAAEVIATIGTDKAADTISKLKQDFLYDYLIERFE